MTTLKKGLAISELTKAGRQRTRLRILAYHTVADLATDPVLAEYGVPPPLFAAQLDDLAARGWEFVSLDAVLASLDGGVPLPRRALLLTFDDAYADLLEIACPLLRDRGIAAVVFAVADRVGATNLWNQVKGAGSLKLLDATGLLAVAKHGVEVGSHSATHRSLPKVDNGEVEEELAGSAATLESLGLPRPRVFSYPYGGAGVRLAEAVRGAGYEVAFTTAWGEPGGADRYLLPRVEVHASDTPRKLRLKLAAAGWPRLPATASSPLPACGWILLAAKPRCRSGRCPGLCARTPNLSWNRGPVDRP
jgi:peptidoglycan/xylan/chitin deacetylase (PgdA/CDA1 family)